jgi:hypothetical protein
MRKLAPKNLDKFAASPVGDKIEFKRAFDLAKETYPNVALGYIGTDGKEHFFEERGERLAYVVPASDYFMTDQDWIKDAIETDCDALKDGVRWLFNCREVEINLNDGTIWIADPQRGHWLSADDLAVVSKALKAGDI